MPSAVSCYTLPPQKVGQAQGSSAAAADPLGLIQSPPRLVCHQCLKQWNLVWTETTQTCTCKHRKQNPMGIIELFTLDAVGKDTALFA